MAKAFRPAMAGRADLGGTAPAETRGGVVREKEGYLEREWNVLGHTCLPKEVTPSSFSWHAVFPPHTAMPLHVHAEQDEFVYVLEGRFDFAIGGEEVYATQFDLVSLPRGVPHSIANRSRHICKCLCWVSPAGDLPALFEAIHNLPRQDEEAIAALAAEHGLAFSGR